MQTEDKEKLMEIALRKVLAAEKQAEALDRIAYVLETDEGARQIAEAIYTLRKEA